MDPGQPLWHCLLQTFSVGSSGHPVPFICPHRASVHFVSSLARPDHCQQGYPVRESDKSLSGSQILSLSLFPRGPESLAEWAQVHHRVLPTHADFPVPQSVPPIFSIPPRALPAGRSQQCPRPYLRQLPLSRGVCDFSCSPRGRTS